MKMSTDQGKNLRRALTITAAVGLLPTGGSAWIQTVKATVKLKGTPP
jgi:hypothetical protein